VAAEELRHLQAPQPLQVFSETDHGAAVRVGEGLGGVWGGVANDEKGGDVGGRRDGQSNSALVQRPHPHQPLSTGQVLTFNANS